MSTNTSTAGLHEHSAYVRRWVVTDTHFPLRHATSHVFIGYVKVKATSLVLAMAENLVKVVNDSNLYIFMLKVNIAVLEGTFLDHKT